jgi:hypothetical protein
MRSVALLVVSLLFLVSGLTPSQAAPISVYEQTLAATVTAVHGIAITKTADETSSELGILQPNERVIIIGRNADSTWVRVRSGLGMGYVTTSALEPEASIDNMPVVGGDLPAEALPDSVPVDDAVKYPILPTVTEYSKQIYQKGLRLGNRSDVFSKIGDCMTADNHLFLGRFGAKQYKLADHGYLQDVIAFYSQTEPYNGQKNSFLGQGPAAAKGFTAASVEDPIWASPRMCRRGETPLSCDFRLARPAVALIMFGTSDVVNLTLQEFDFYLRLVIHDTLSHGIVPLMTTFPGDPYHEAKTHQVNQVIFQVARAYDVPVLNLWLALQPLPYHGRNPNSMYLSRMLTTDNSNFAKANLQWGVTMRNLVTLQSLDILWRGLIQPTL